MVGRSNTARSPRTLQPASLQATAQGRETANGPATAASSDNPAASSWGAEADCVDQERHVHRLQLFGTSLPRGQSLTFRSGS